MGLPAVRDAGRLTLSRTLERPAVPPRPQEAAAPRPAGGRRGGRVELLAVGAYLVLSVLLHARPLLRGEPTGSIAADSGLFAWWLEWNARALAQGVNPLYTTWMHAPDGVNALWNTTVPVLGVLLAPITWIAGPTAAYDVGMVLGPVASAAAAVLALRPWVAAALPRAVAGALYGFGPFMVAHAWAGHLNLVWMVLPPVVLWAARSIVVTTRRPWRDGALFGLAMAVQTGLYTQTVALAAIVLVVVGVVLALWFPCAAARRFPSVARSAAAAVGVYVALCAYPLHLLLAGPGRPRAPIRDVSLTGADAANLVLPSALGAAPGSGLGAGMRGYVGEQGSFLGVAVLLVVGVTLVVVRRRDVRIAAVVTAVVAVLSLGTELVVLGHDTGLPLPWHALTGIPLVAEAEPGRLAPFVALGVVLVVAVGLDHALRARRRLAVLGIALAALTWAPAGLQESAPVTVPSFFTAGAPGLTDGEIVESWPRASGRWADGADPLWWQVAADLRYRQTGGYFIGSDGARPLLLEGPVGEYHRGAAGLPARADVARAELAARGVGAVLVVPRADVDLPTALRWTAAVTGAPPREVDGVWLFDVAPGRGGAR